LATRRERVILDLEDNFTPGVARAAVAAGVLDKALNDLDGSGRRSSKGLDESAKSTKRVGDESRNAGPDIDKYSGRLRTLADAALTLGPALIPIGAAAIPALTAALAGLGSAAGAIGLTVLAFHGLGDGLKAIDAYQLEPTAENLSKLRIEMEKLGPAGAHFAHFLDDLEPKLSDLQNIARAGIFPGVEDGIDALLTKLPQVRRIVADLATGMGDLAREGGESLAGPKFTAFFDYIESDARPTLEEFAKSAGNVAEGVANLLVAFAPLSRDFTGGLEKATAAFAKWSRGLDENQGFQDFLTYVRESGPQVVALLGALAQAFGGLLHAAAPFGRAVVPALTAIAKAFAAISNSPIGPPLYTAAAALTIFNRAASLTQRSVTSLSTGFERLSGQAGTSQGKLGALLGRGGVVFAGAAAVGMLADNINRIDSSKLDASLEALKFGDVTPTIDKVADSIQQLGSNWNKIDFGEIVTVGGLLGDTSLDKFANNVDQVDKALAQMVQSGNVDEAATLFKKLQDVAAAKGVDPSEVTKRFDDYALALHNVGEEAYRASGATNPFSGALKVLEGQLRTTKDAATDLSGALAALNGWFDKRQAVRDYRDSIKELSKSLKNGFTRKDAENLDAVGRNILQVAQSIKDPKLQRDFLQNARAGLVDLAEHSGPKAAAALQRLIDKFDDEKLTHPPKAKLDVDTKAADSKIDATTVRLHKYGNTVAIAKADANIGAATSAINQVTTMLRNLNGTTATTYVRTVRNDIPLPGRSAEGGTVPKTGMGYADRWPYMLADGEEVISNRYGQADRHRALLKAINAQGMAGGGTAGGNQTYTSSLHHGGGGFGDAIQIWTDGVYTAAKALKALNVELAAQKKVYDKAKSARDQALSNRNDLSSTIQQSLMGDSIFSDIPAAGSIWAAGSTAGGPATPQSAIAALNARKDRAQRFLAAVNTLKGKGVTGAALQAILGEGLEAAEAMAAADVGTLSSFSSALNESNQALAAAGLAGGNAVFGGDVKATQHALNQAVKELHEIKQAIHDMDKANQKGHKDNAKDVKDGVNGAASNGHRRGHR
jgi:hypothetical protein